MRVTPQARGGLFRRVNFANRFLAGVDINWSMLRWISKAGLFVASEVIGRKLVLKVGVYDPLYCKWGPTTCRRKRSVLDKTVCRSFLIRQTAGMFKLDYEDYPPTSDYKRNLRDI